jgi:hypothetical protein
MLFRRCEWRVCDRGHSTSKPSIHIAPSYALRNCSGNLPPPKKSPMDEILVDVKSMFTKYRVDCSSHHMRGFVWDFKDSQSIPYILNGVPKGYEICNWCKMISISNGGCRHFRYDYWACMNILFIVKKWRFSKLLNDHIGPLDYVDYCV